MQADVEIKGVEELVRALRDFTDKEVNTYVRKGCKAGADLVADQMRATAPELSGKMKRAVRVTSRATKKKIYAAATIGKRFFTGETFYAGFVVFGHKQGSRKLGDARKQIPPNNFMQESLVTRGDEAAQLATDTIWFQIEANHPDRNPA